MSEGGLYTRPWVVRAQENFWITCSRNFAHLAGVRWGACSGGDHGFELQPGTLCTLDIYRSS